MPTHNPAFRRIRSFVRREGRLTTGQARALADVWPRYGIADTDAPLDLRAVFGRSAPTVLEIGFGNGESLVQMAAAAPQKNFLGIEVHRPGVGNLLLQLEQRGLDNVRVMQRDAVEVLNLNIPDNVLDAVHLFFPDPWPKKRHHKRRIVQPEFVSLVARRLRPGGVFHMATDWQDYAEHMMAVMSASPAFENCAGPGAWSSRPDDRPETRFERRGQRLGHGVWDLLFRKTK
jgi:tRNA (guanine-N7-)-methyltransferase